jgi:murein DD-endopeptidase MepM/ murein hydrolase activator NlpD
MSFPTPTKLQFPITPYEVTGYPFHKMVRRWYILWATHLGDDITAPAGTHINAIGDGEVVWSQMRLGDELKRNWGGIIVIGHQAQKPSNKIETFYSVYGHMTDLQFSVGDKVSGGQQIGVVAKGYTPENGWWKLPHVHFGIYTGPWKDEIVPGYKRIEESRTKTKWWKNPKTFIDQYNE